MVESGEALGTVIKEAREARGYTRAQLAAKAKISPVYVGKIELCQRRPSARILAAIGTALELSSAELMARAAVHDAADAPDNDELLRRLLRAATLATGSERGAGSSPFGQFIQSAVKSAIVNSLTLTPSAVTQPPSLPVPQAVRRVEPPLAGSARARLRQLLDHHLSEEDCRNALSALGFAP